TKLPPLWLLWHTGTRIRSVSTRRRGVCGTRHRASHAAVTRPHTLAAAQQVHMPPLTRTWYAKTGRSVRTSGTGRPPGSTQSGLRSRAAQSSAATRRPCELVSRRGAVRLGLRATRGAPVIRPEPLAATRPGASRVHLTYQAVKV